jgi:hypothetical protein
MLPRAFWHYLGAFYLTVQSVGALLWWSILGVEPRARPFFRPGEAPDAVLLAFFLPDAILFIGAALWAARALMRSPKAARLPLALHTGAATYAALYCIAQWLLTGETFWAALFMSPCLVVQPLLLWVAWRD